MNLVKNYIKYGLIILSILAVVLTVYTATTSKTSLYYELYKSAEENRNKVYAYTDQLRLEADTELKKRESDLAKIKVIEYLSGVRPLEEDENLLDLVKKIEWDKQPEQGKGNFVSTEIGGIDNFLEINGAEFVKETGDLFKAAGLLYNVKPEILVCIAQADSSLGNALKTTNNIGNVGNTDGGAIKHYDTLEQGIAAIGDVLNNHYLKGNTLLGQLSGGGRTILGTDYGCANAISPYKCYATSEFNWNKNVRECLQDILQDESVDESFEFRT